VVRPIRDEPPLEEGEAPSRAVGLRPDDRNRLRRRDVEPRPEVRDREQAEPLGQEVGGGVEGVAGAHGRRRVKYSPNGRLVYVAEHLHDWRVWVAADFHALVAEEDLVDPNDVRVFGTAF